MYRDPEVLVIVTVFLTSLGKAHKSLCMAAFNCGVNRYFDCIF